MFNKSIGLFFFAVSISSVAQSQIFDLNDVTVHTVTDKSSSSKMDFQLHRTIAMAQANNVDLKSVSIAGIMKTTSDIVTAKQIKAIFRDPTAKIRSLMKAQDGNIITFSSTLHGAWNAAQSKKVHSIQMSHKLN